MIEKVSEQTEKTAHSPTQRATKAIPKHCRAEQNPDRLGGLKAVEEQYLRKGMIAI